MVKKPQRKRLPAKTLTLTLNCVGKTDKTLLILAYLRYEKCWDMQVNYYLHWEYFFMLLSHVHRFYDRNYSRKCL
jgi:hypothetical protein